MMYNISEQPNSFSKRGDTMLNYKCPKCGGEMSVNRSGDLLCSYCDSKFNFSDKELKDYKEFRYNMLHYLRKRKLNTLTSNQPIRK